MVAGGGRVEPCLSRDQATSIWCCETGHWHWATPSTTKSRLSESLLGSSELASKDMVVGDNNIGGWWSEG